MDKRQEQQQQEQQGQTNGDQAENQSETIAARSCRKRGGAIGLAD
jgi:hypothetical protein